MVLSLVQMVRKENLHVTQQQGICDLNNFYIQKFLFYASLQTTVRNLGTCLKDSAQVDCHIRS